jgi:hypothetical protein
LCRQSLGEWHIVAYLPTDDAFTDVDGTTGLTKMSRLEPGTALVQADEENAIQLAPSGEAGDGGIRIGKGPTKDVLHINTKEFGITNGSIISDNFSTSLSFTDAARSMEGQIHRDKHDVIDRELLYSLLDTQSYERQLDSIGIDPKFGVSWLGGASENTKNIGLIDRVRNPPLTESRKVFYECSQEFNVRSDRVEFEAYKGSNTPKIIDNRENIRADTLSLSLERPNNLIEKIYGTVSDSAGNVLDLNRDVLPVGAAEGFGFNESSDIPNSFAKIRSQLRKSLAYHFEINSRKGFELDPSKSSSYPEVEGDKYKIVDAPDVNLKNNYARSRSRFFLDIDKEGQFKLNVPASSEVGNVGLLTRYENFSNVEAANETDGSVKPNSFVISDDFKDILIENFANYKADDNESGVKLKSGDSSLKDFVSPLDRFSEKRIKLGTVYHDISNTISEYQPAKSYRETAPESPGIDFKKLVPYDEDSALNFDAKEFEFIVSKELTVSGEEANSGGRSGTINLDGMVNINVGANTVDRQSVWFDYAGGIVGNVGRDKQGVSYAASFDGDVLLQVGGVGLDSSSDSRFSLENSAFRNGAFEIRVLNNAGVMSILRIYSGGIDIVTPGQMRFSSGGNMVFHSESDILLDAPIVRVYKETDSSTTRPILRNTTPIT